MLGALVRADSLLYARMVISQGAAGGTTGSALFINVFHLGWGNGTGFGEEFCTYFAHILKGWKVEWEKLGWREGWGEALGAGRPVAWVKVSAVLIVSALRGYPS